MGVCLHHPHAPTVNSAEKAHYDVYLVELFAPSLIGAGKERIQPYLPYGGALRARVPVARLVHLLPQKLDQFVLCGVCTPEVSICEGDPMKSYD